MSGKFLLCSLSLIYFLLPNGIEADGMVKVRFLNFDNKDGTANNGHCCDGKWGMCQPHGCDHIFKICLDKPGGQKSTDRCAYGKREAEPIRNVNTIPFGSKINNIDNPLTFVFFEPLPNEVVLKVAIYDHDRMSDDEFVDYLEQPITQLTTIPVDYTLMKRTTLRVQVFIECTQNFYGPKCSKFCHPAPQNQYLCDPKTGNKICTLGWTGEDCSERAGAHV